MAFNVPEEEKPAFNKNVQSGLNLFAKDVQRTLGQLEVLQPQTLVEAYDQPVQPPVTRNLTPLEQYVYEPQPVPEVGSLTDMPAKESMVVPQEQPQVLSNFRNQAEAQFSRDMVSITPYEQAVTDVIGAEVDSLRNDVGEIAKSPLEVFSKPLNANSVRALGLVDQDGNPTERGQLFYNLQQSGVFNEDGTINKKGIAYLTPVEDMQDISGEWVNNPENREIFDTLWKDGLIRTSGSLGDIGAGVVDLLKKGVMSLPEGLSQGAQAAWYNSQTWPSLIGRDDRRPQELRDKMVASEYGIYESFVKDVIGLSGMAGIAKAKTKSVLSGVLPQEVEDEADQDLVRARYDLWNAQQNYINKDTGELAETILNIDGAVKQVDEVKSRLGKDEFNKQYGQGAAFQQLFLSPTNLVSAKFAMNAATSAPIATRVGLTAQRRLGDIARQEMAIAQGKVAVAEANSLLKKEAASVNVANRLSSDISARAGANPELVARANQASQVATRLTEEANKIRATLPAITTELDNLVAKRNSLATRIPEAYSQKVLQTMELGRQMRSMPAKAVGATLERVGDTISKTDTAVTNFLQERGLDQMYTAAVGAAGVVGLAGNPIIGALGAGAAALKTGKVLSSYGKLFRYVGKEMENVRAQMPFWKRVARHTAPGSLSRGFAHTFNMLDLGGVTSDTIRRAGRGIAAAAPTDLMFEYLSDGADMRPETLYQAGAESFFIGGSFAAGGGAFMGTKKRMRELSIGDEINFRRDLTDPRQKALFEAIPAGTRRAISTYAIANPTLNYIFKDSGASRYDPNTNTAVINVNSTNPIKALVAHETLHHTVIKNNMEPGISALFLGDTKNNTVGGLFRSRDGKLDPNFEAFRDGYYKRLGVEGMSNAERDAIYPLDKIAVEYFIEKHADQYAAMAESGELGAVAASGAARRKLGSILETVLPRIPVLKDLHFKSGGMIDKNGAWVTGNGILDAEGVKRDPITSKMFRDMNRRSAGLVPGQFDPLMSDKPDSGAPILLNPADGIDAELLHPLVQVDDANKPILKDGKPVALDRATELSRALAGLTAKEVLQRKRSENYAPEKGEAYVDDEGQFQPGWLSNDVLTEMFAKNNYNPEQKRIIREMNKLIRKGAGDRVVMINFPATTRNKAGKVVYKPQGATLRDTVPVAVTISKDGNLLFGLMSVTKLHENIQKRSQDRRGKKLYGGNVDLILRDTQAMMDYHKQGVDSIEFFKQKYGAVEADERKKFINTMFGLLNQKEQAVLNPILLEDGVKSRDNVYRTYRADRVSKAIPMSPEEYAAMPFSYEAVSAVRMPEQRQMPEVSTEESKNWFKQNRSNFIHVNIRGNEIDSTRDFTGWVLPVGRDAVPDANVMNTRYGNVGKQVVLVPKEFVTNSKYNPDKIKPGFRPSPEQIGTITEESINKNGTIDWSKVFAKPTEPTPAPSQRFMPEGVDEDKFYSQLDRVITDKVPTRATAAQIMATIDPTRGSGVKAEEIKWSGIEQALASLEKDGKVSKEDLLNYLRNEGRVRFEEVTLSKPRKVSEMSVSEWAKETMPEQYAQWESATDPEDKAFFAQLLQKEYDWRAFAGAYSKGKGDPKYAQYQLPGGGNYREVVLAMPGDNPELDKISQRIYGKNYAELTPVNFSNLESTGAVEAAQARVIVKREARSKGIDATPQTYTSSHFRDIPNYVAHMRTNERVDADGRPGLFVEEFQSDRHQEGRKKGYRGSTESPYSLVEVPNGYDIVGNNERYFGGTTKESAEVKLKKYESRYIAAKEINAVADAPFRTTWPLQLFKRALRDAVDSGKEWVGWTTGETQNDRFDLSKQIDRLTVTENQNIIGSYRVEAFKDGGRAIDRIAKEEELPDIIGKDLAQKVLDDIQESKQRSKPSYSTTLSGLDLRVGGSGMKGFYDTMLPKEIGKYVKPFGGKVEKSQIKDLSELKKYVSSYSAWLEYIDPDGLTSPDEFYAMSEAERLAAVPEDGTTKPTPIWKVSITPEMRKLAQAGQMRFMPEMPNAPQDTGFRSITEQGKEAIGSNYKSVAPGLILGTMRFMPEAENDRILANFPLGEDEKKKLEGKAGFAFVSDWSDSNRPYITKNGREIDVLMGGVGYTYHPEVIGKGGWAGSFSGLTNRVLNKINETDGIGLVVAGGRDSTASSRSFSIAALEEIKDDISNGTVSKSAIDNIIKNNAERLLGLKNIKSLGDYEKLVMLERGGSGLTFEQRADMIKAINSHENKKSFGISNWNDILKKYEMQNGIFVPGQIMSVVQFKKNAPLMKASDLNIKGHKSYEAVIQGKPIGMLKEKVMIGDFFKDFFTSEGTLPASYTRKVQTKMPSFKYGEGSAVLKETAKSIANAAKLK